MTQVRTTVTTIDLLEKRRVLNLEIANKKKDLETITIQSKEVSDGVADSVRRLKELSDDFDIVLKDIENLSGIQKDASNKSSDVIQLANYIIESSLNFLSFLNKRIETVKEEINNLNKKQEEIHNGIIKEQSTINRSWNDLYIYRDRLQKYIDESGAPIKLKL
mgnify:FL=1